MNSTDTDHLISLSSVATRLGISKRGLYRLIARKELPNPVKIGGSSKLFNSDLIAYMDRLKSQRQRQP